MADEQDRWLDRETAERLLRGEPLDTPVDATARDRAERLTETLGALSAATPPPSSAELPGEAAALAAFRAARAARDAERPATARRTRARTPYAADAGLVRLGRSTPPARRPRWGRPVRLGLSAALAAGMVGGVAVAVGTGVLPAPFGGPEPVPAASAPAAASPGRPLLPPTPGEEMGGSTGLASPGGSTGTSPGRDPARGTTRGTDNGATAEGGDPDALAGSGPRSGSSWSGAAAACREVRAGRELGTERRRALEGVAGGSTRVWKYCKGVLATAASGTDHDTRAKGESEDDSRGDSKGDSKGDSPDDSRGETGKGRGGRGGDDGRGHGRGGHRHSASASGARR
ncbi:hypothetical protein ACFV0T_10605 [Streptomyces sp. NPDC059582]|uniref:hypothetical protein n=1 Tax=Streptomyces sp. NPDC059582 TaxID=3346875 RepID=UPI0036ACE037